VLSGYFAISALLHSESSEPLNLVADRVYAKLLAGESDGLYPMLVPNEVETMNPTPEKFERMIVWAHDQLRGYKQDAGRVDQKAAYEGLFTRTLLKDDAGHETSFEVPIFPTKDGPKIFVSSLIYAALPAKRMMRYDGQPKEIAFVKASRDTIIEDRAALESFAAGLPESEGAVKSRLVGWDEMLTKLDDQLRYYSSNRNH
jgi:hypothetical protein